MSDTTRRGFVKNSAAAAAGMTVVGALVAEQADAKVAAKSGPVVAYIRDPRTGEISVMAGEREVKLHDRKIAARQRPRGEPCHGGNQCRLTAKRRRSARTRSPTTPTRTRSSVPRRPGHGHDDRQLPAARGAVRRSELLRVRRRRPVPHQHRQRRRRRRRHHLRVRVRDRRSATRTRSSTTPARSLSIDSSNWNRKQFYSVTRISARQVARCSAANLPCPPCNVGPLSTPNYATLASAGDQHACPAGGPCSRASGSRGSTSTSGRSSTWANLRPFENLHVDVGLPALSAAVGVNGTDNFGVHSIALKVPMSDLTRHGSTPTDASSRRRWSACGRPRAGRPRSCREPRSEYVHEAGEWVQVSRLG